MNTARLRAMQKPSRVQELLDDFVLKTQQLSQCEQPLRTRRELPAALQRAVVHAERAEEAWSAWSSHFRTRLLVAEMPLERSREQGCPVLAIRSYDERTGRAVSSAHYRLTDAGTWVRCCE